MDNTRFPEKMKFTDKEIVLDMLQGIKQLAVQYTNAALECTNDVIRSTLSKLAQEKIRDVGMLFDIAEEKGWYTVEPATNVRQSTSVNPDNIQ